MAKHMILLRDAVLLDCIQFLEHCERESVTHLPSLSFDERCFAITESINLILSKKRLVRFSKAGQTMVEAVRKKTLASRCLQTSSSISTPEVRLRVPSRQSAKRMEPTTK